MSKKITVFEAAITRYYSYQAIESLPEEIEVLLFTAEMKRCPNALKNKVKYAPLPFRVSHYLAWRVSRIRRFIPDLYNYFDRLACRRLKLNQSASVAHLWSGTSLNTLRWAKQHFGGKLVVERSGSHIELQYQMLCEEAERTKNKLGGMPVFDPDLRKRMLEEYELADTILVPSEYAKKTFVDCGLPADKVEVIPLGTNAKAVESLPAKKSRLSVLFVGGEPLRKGLFTLLDVWESLAPDADLYVVTDHSRVPSDKHDIAGVNFLPFMDHSALTQLMSECHLLCLPSVEDGFGMVVSEAMAMGTAVLVSTNCGASELVNHGFNGSIFSAGDAASLMENLSQLLASEERLLEMCDHARTSLDGASWAAYGQKLANFYRRSSDA
ncbi:MAG: glycosyltransferase [Verrucomicrobiota bacterium]